MVVLELLAVALAVICVVLYTTWEGGIISLIGAALSITNSLDKLNGSRLFLQSVTSLPITGIIATHDLELSKMQQEHPDRFHNYCFEIQLSDEITYTYRLSEGVARNQNATYLLKNILKKAFIRT